MKKNEITTDKSLSKSLNLINQLLIKSFDTSIVQIIFIDKHQTFIYPNQQTTHRSFNHQEGIIKESLTSENILISNNYPFMGISEEIKFYASAPLISFSGNIFGVLILLDTKNRDFSTKEISLLENIAQITTNSIEKHLESRKLQAVFSDFLHKAVHDLKNPLTSISLTSELIKRKAENAQTVISLSEHLEKASQKAFSNLENLKSAFPIENNSFRLDTQEIKLDDFFADIKGSFRKNSISVENKLETGIYADYNRLKDAIIQLIGHDGLNLNEKILIKSYSRDRKAIIEISGKEIFNFDSTTLTISKTLIEMHKGKIEIGERAYYISLPLETP